MRRDSGFTLIEILLVAAIIGVVTAISVPVIADAMNRYEVISTSQQVASTIRTARLQAVARNQILEVQFDNDAGTYQVFLDGGGTPVGDVQRLPADVTFAEGSATMVEIGPDGRVTAAANFTVTNGNAEDDRTINVSLSGRVQIQ